MLEPQDLTSTLVTFFQDMFFVFFFLMFPPSCLNLFGVRIFSGEPLRKKRSVLFFVQPSPSSGAEGLYIDCALLSDEAWRHLASSLY